MRPKVEVLGVEENSDESDDSDDKDDSDDQGEEFDWYIQQEAPQEGEEVLGLNTVRDHGYGFGFAQVQGQAFLTVLCRAVDPDSDPAFQVNPDTDLHPIPIQGFDDQKPKKKNTAENFCKSFLIKSCNLLMSKLQEKPSSLKSEHPALQK